MTLSQKLTFSTDFYAPIPNEGQPSWHQKIKSGLALVGNFGPLKKMGPKIEWDPVAIGCKVGNVLQVAESYFRACQYLLAVIDKTHNNSNKISLEETLLIGPT